MDQPPHDSTATPEQPHGVLPSVSLPKGGGSVRGLGEKFSVNAANGTAGLSIPIPASAGRGIGPELALTYDSGAGNGPFGIGWSAGVKSITRKTDKGLPRYWDGDESDVFILSGAEDLVPTSDCTTPTASCEAHRCIVDHCYLMP
ncbi:MAG TPA: SpvB/TcaC N-terminal domain-containing protein [Polyangia bacterium]